MRTLTVERESSDEKQQKLLKTQSISSLFNDISLFVGYLIQKPSL